MENQIVERLLATLAAKATQEARWNGREWSADESPVAIAALQGSSLGADWRTHLPDEIVNLWDDLPAAAQMAAFLVAADCSLQAEQ